MRKKVHDDTMKNIKHLLYYEVKLRNNQVLYLDRFKIYLPQVSVLHYLMNND